MGYQDSRLLPWSGSDEADGGEVGCVASPIAGEEGTSRCFRMGSNEEICEHIGFWAVLLSVLDESFSGKERCLAGDEFDAEPQV